MILISHFAIVSMNKKKLAEQIIDCNFDQIWTEIRNTLEKVFNTIFHLIIWICKIPNERFMAFYIWLMNSLRLLHFAIVNKNWHSVPFAGKVKVCFEPLLFSRIAHRNWNIILFGGKNNISCNFPSLRKYHLNYYNKMS